MNEEKINCVHLIKWEKGKMLNTDFVASVSPRLGTSWAAGTDWLNCNFRFPVKARAQTRRFDAR